MTPEPGFPLREIPGSVPQGYSTAPPVLAFNADYVALYMYDICYIYGRYKEEA